jgi:hypothetical protein
MNLADITRHYIKHFRPKKQSELDWFKNQPTLGSAIIFAALAQDCRGKRFRHQTRIKKTVLEQAKERLLSLSNEIRDCRNFDELLMLIESNLDDIRGVGELYFYDTALRISAKPNLLPEKVYLHAGTRGGARILGYNPKKRFLELSVLPNEFQVLVPHEVEDVLCIYKDALRRRALAKL